MVASTSCHMGAKCGISNVVNGIEWYALHSHGLIGMQQIIGHVIKLFEYLRLGVMTSREKASLTVRLRESLHLIRRSNNMEYSKEKAMADVKHPCTNF